MLRIEVPMTAEGWDEKKRQFVEPKIRVLELEHSLISLSKWESTWHKPFYSKKKKTAEEVLDYIKCMTISKNVEPEVYHRLTDENIEAINEYIENSMTATTFSPNSNTQVGRETITAELIYYWMLVLNIPFEECQKWHINRLITLIKVCDVKNTPAKKRSNNQIIQDYAAINEVNRKKFNSKG